VKTLVAATAAARGMNHKMMNLQYEQNKPDSSRGQSIFDSAGRQRGASMFGARAGESAGARDLDYSASIFNMLNTGASMFGNRPSFQQGQQSNNEVNRKRKNEPNSGNNAKSHPRLGEKTKPTLTAEEKAAKEEERLQKALVDRLNKTTPNRIIRSAKFFDANNPLHSMKTEYGEPALDSMDLGDHILRNVTPGGYTHQFLESFMMPNFAAIETKNYQMYGHDKANESYYGQATGGNFRAPRKITSGVITLGDDRVDTLAETMWWK